MKTVVFVRRGPLFRVYNQAYALKQTNRYRLICVIQTMDRSTVEMFSKVFDDIILYYPLDFKYWLGGKKPSWMGYLLRRFFYRFVDSNLRYFTDQIKLPDIIDDIDADVFNCLIRPYKLCSQILNHSGCSVVLDAYDFDGLMHGIDNIADVVRNREKSFFRMAKGIIHHSPDGEIDYFRDNGYEVSCPSLPWLDYCNREFFVDNSRKLSDEDDEYHVVQVGGGISPAHLPFVKNLIEQKIHFHIYPMPLCMTPFTYRKFSQLDRTERYIHLERSVPYSEITREIAKYDFGSHIHLTYLAPVGFKFAHSHKFFCYLEAGLPIIVSDCLQYIKKTVVESKAGFSVRDTDFPVLHKMIERYDYDDLRRNVMEAREKLLIDNHAERLINFYDSIGE